MARLVSRVSARGRTVIPQDLREALGIEPGTRLAWSASGGSLVATPEAVDPVRSLRGILRGIGPTTAELLESRRRERAAERRADRKSRVCCGPVGFALRTRHVINRVQLAPVEIVESDPVWRTAAAEVKARGGLSVADAWMAGLALVRGAALVHKDPEFDAFAELSVLRLP